MFSKIENLILSRFRFQNLLVWLFLYIIAGPVLTFFPHTGLLIQALFTAVLFSAIYTIHTKNRLKWTALGVLVLTTILLWGNIFGLIQSSTLVIDGLLVLYLGMMVASFSHHIFTSKQVDVELISAALCLYLLLAMLWTSLFTLLEGFMPGSFAGSGLAQAETIREYHQYFSYLSFVTITTLGYGDITPQTPLAMTLCQIEAILGQFFIAVLVARLVGIQVAQSFTKRKQ